MIPKCRILPNGSRNRITVYAVMFDTVYTVQYMMIKFR